jgi:hypothetical protein
MARYRIPGPLDASRGNHTLRDGTSQRMPEAIWQETGHAIGNLVKGLIPGLLMTMVVEGICAVVGGAADGIVGAALGALAGGVGAAPGAVAGAATGVQMGLSLGAALLAWLGLGFLLVRVGEGLLEQTSLKAWEMCPTHHGRTSSNGQMRGSIDYREAIANLIADGKWREAMSSRSRASGAWLVRSAAHADTTKPGLR